MRWWVFELDGTVRSRLSGQCLDVQAWSTQPGAPVQMWDCHSGDNQRWSRWSDGTIRNVSSGQCLTIACWGQSCAWGGHELMQWPCVGDTTQRFTTQNPDYNNIPR